MSARAFNQVLLFRDKRNSLELGSALWSALAEISSLYNFDQIRADFRRYYFAQTVPEGIEQDFDFDQERTEAALGSRNWWELIGGWSSAVPPLDKEVLLDQVRKLLDRETASEPLLVVTDLEIQPPPGWRYVIWEGDVGKGSAVSLAPTDPEFWGLKEENRISTIKHRVRTASLSCVGENLGFTRCNNQNCFLYEAVASVDHLDSMIFFGAEHRVPKLAGLGFAPKSVHPSEVRLPEQFFPAERSDRGQAAVASESYE